MLEKIVNKVKSKIKVIAPAIAGVALLASSFIPTYRTESVSIPFDEYWRPTQTVQATLDITVNEPKSALQQYLFLCSVNNIAPKEEFLSEQKAGEVLAYIDRLGEGDGLHITEKGDSLWKIVEMEYSFPTNQQTLDKVNEVVARNAQFHPSVKENPNLIYAGQAFVLPGAIDGNLNFIPPPPTPKVEEPKLPKSPIVREYKVKNDHPIVAVASDVKSEAEAYFSEQQNRPQAGDILGGMIGATLVVGSVYTVSSIRKRPFAKVSLETSFGNGDDGLESILDAYTSGKSAKKISSDMQITQEQVYDGLAKAYKRFGSYEVTKFDYRLAEARGDLDLIKNAYLGQATVADALKSIKEQTGMSMSKSSLYRTLHKMEIAEGKIVGNK